ncbi:TPA: hypothetical protein ACHOT2_001367 [Escherichia coli]|nr:hypothetical protein [Escherichia coli]MDV5029440.1 hypothetical protein [Escherichia coli]MDV5074361.1 hypothetical protein [Escherichia coli]MDX4966714.1 hypothetical protein [Escherichia coli]
MLRNRARRLDYKTMR